MQEFSKTRELLVEAQTSKKHLDDKVEDLTKQLKGNEEKLVVYERRPGATSTIQTMDQDVSREQQLETEVAELRFLFLRLSSIYIYMTLMMKVRLESHAS